MHEKSGNWRALEGLVWKGYGDLFHLGCLYTIVLIGVGGGVIMYRGLLCCTKPHIHKFHIKQHNKAVYEIRKLPISNTKSRCFILGNAGKSDGQPQENIVSTWLLPCNCNNQTQRCQCNAKFKPDILCIRNHPYNGDPPQESNHTLIVQFIEFRDCNDRYSTR